jgi:hypothetical protein
MILIHFMFCLVRDGKKEAFACIVSDIIT